MNLTSLLNYKTIKEHKIQFEHKNFTIKFTKPLC